MKSILLYPAVPCLLLLFFLTILTGCKDGTRPGDSDASVKPEPKARQEPVPEESDLKRSVQSKPEEVLDPEMEEKIDRFLAGDDGSQKDINELIQDPQFMALFQTLGKPSEATASRMQSAMQLLMESKESDAGLKELGEGSRGVDESVSVGSGDPELLRTLLRAALNEDAEEFYGAFADAIEESALVNLIDPEAETSVKVIE